MMGSLIIVLFFSVGLIAGIYGISLNFLQINDPSIYALYLLMFLVGIGIGADSNVWGTLKKMNLKILVVPFIVIAGTLSGTYICSFFLEDVGALDSMAIGSGFGYYSLSSIIISKMRNDTLGVMALLANISREIFTLLATPLLVRYFGKLAPIASGGATSMDTTLPVIAKYSGKDYAVISVFSGVVLTILVPFIIALIYRFI
ncbi:MAG TPA: lysine exporter LysO family protein [Spirochaetota bacterium]|nr:lysine exporter LysO family protein [Spirochaetota bacterium]